jgi:hypothetical protein
MKDLQNKFLELEMSLNSLKESNSASFGIIGKKMEELDTLKTRIFYLEDTRNLNHENENPELHQVNIKISFLIFY